MPDELLKEFLIESHENLDRLDQDFVALEKNARDRDRLSSIFRTVHTIKGTCGFLGLDTLQSISHVGENLLSKLRDGQVTLDAEITTALLAMVDAIRRILAALETTGSEGTEDFSHVVEELERLNDRGSRAADVAPLTIDAVEDPRSGDDRRGPVDRRGGYSDASLRVDVGVLDTLVRLVDELAAARNQILELARPGRDRAFADATERLDAVTSELQDSVMKTRRQPIGTIWSRFPRIARDLAAQCGKQVRIEMEGQDTPLDTTILEAIKAPLTHVLRNSVDHGIEAPPVRSALGKPPEGVIRLRAFQQRGEIHIEIADDGAGIDPARVRAKAVERGLVTAEGAARLSDADAVRLVFLPGVTTLDTVSTLSGRGVGMDVVRTNLERIGGEADVDSTPGAGTVLRLRIPLAAGSAIARIGRAVPVVRSAEIEEANVRDTNGAAAELARTTAELRAMVKRLEK